LEEKNGGAKIEKCENRDLKGTRRGEEIREGVFLLEAGGWWWDISGGQLEEGAGRIRVS